MNIKENNGKTDNKSISISYSWDDSEHKEWVQNLAERLIHDGFAVNLDRIDTTVGDHINNYMEKLITDADHVLIIMTPNYKEKADELIGGTGYEYSLITSQLKEDLMNKRKKFLPILRKGSKDNSVPEFLKSYIFSNMANDENFEDEYIELVEVMSAGKSLIRHPSRNKSSLENGELNSPNVGNESNFIIPIPKMKKGFTDYENRQFIEEAFTKMQQYFKVALKKLEESDSECNTNFDLITSNKFVCEIYYRGDLRAVCKIWKGKSFSSFESITYLDSTREIDINYDNSMNDYLNIVDDGNQLYLEKSAMDYLSGVNKFSDKRNLSIDEGCEYFWLRFIHNLNV
jgi:hypothetical protein